MSHLRPFKALRPTPPNVRDVAAVPYDVVNAEEASALARHPLSFLHVSRAEIDLPAGTDPYCDAVYQKALDNFRALRHEAPLEMDETPCLYVYRLRMGDHVQTGIAATWSLDEYDTDKIKKHERTRKDKEDDRTRHILTLMAQTGPVFLAYRDVNSVNELVRTVTKTTPFFDFVAVDGVAHTLWRVTKTESLVEAFKKVPLLYIADGHHRAASASRARAKMKSDFTENSSSQTAKHWTGEEDANYFLAVAFPASQLRILPYHRLVKDLNGYTRDLFLAALRHQLPVDETDEPSPSSSGYVHMYLPGQWYRIALQGSMEIIDDPQASLDVSLLQERILGPVLGILDQRTDKRIDFVGGIRGTESLRNAVDQGKAAVAFAMYPTSMQQLMAIADADEIMPPKSTWFEPKLRDAVVIHVI